MKRNAETAYRLSKDFKNALALSIQAGLVTVEHAAMMHGLSVAELVELVQETRFQFAGGISNNAAT